MVCYWLNRLEACLNEAQCETLRTCAHLQSEIFYIRKNQWRKTKKYLEKKCIPSISTWSVKNRSYYNKQNHFLCCEQRNRIAHIFWSVTVPPGLAGASRALKLTCSPPLLSSSMYKLRRISGFDFAYFECSRWCHFGLWIDMKVSNYATVKKNQKKPHSFLSHSDIISKKTQKKLLVVTEPMDIAVNSFCFDTKKFARERSRPCVYNSFSKNNSKQTNSASHK